MDKEYLPSGWTMSSIEAVHQLRPNAQRILIRPKIPKSEPGWLCRWL